MEQSWQIGDKYITARGNSIVYTVNGILFETLLYGRNGELIDWSCKDDVIKLTEGEIIKMDNDLKIRNIKKDTAKIPIIDVVPVNDINDNYFELCGKVISQQYYENYSHFAGEFYHEYI